VRQHECDEPLSGFRGPVLLHAGAQRGAEASAEAAPAALGGLFQRETIKLAARLGIGALTFAFVDPAEATQWVDDYYRIFKEECVPIGHAVNPTSPWSPRSACTTTSEVARQRFQEGFRFFQFALGWHYGFGEQIPGRTDIWELFQQAQVNLPVGEAGTLAGAAEGGIATPEGLREHLRSSTHAASTR